MKIECKRVNHTEWSILERTLHIASTHTIFFIIRNEAEETKVDPKVRYVVHFALVYTGTCITIHHSDTI